MPTVTTPTDRLKRILSEGARFTATCPQQTSIDITPDIMALLGGVQTGTVHQTELTPPVKHGTSNQPG
jgi:hypothetical protein